MANVPPRVAAAAVPAAFGCADGAAVVTNPAALGSFGKAATTAEPAGAKPAAVGCAGGSAAAFCGLAGLAGLGLLVLQLAAAELHQQIVTPVSLFLTNFLCYVASVNCLLAECARHAGLPRQRSRDFPLTCIPLCAAWSCYAASHGLSGPSLAMLLPCSRAATGTYIHE